MSCSHPFISPSFVFSLSPSVTSWKCEAADSAGAQEELHQHSERGGGGGWGVGGGGGGGGAPAVLQVGSTGRSAARTLLGAALRPGLCSAAVLAVTHAAHLVDGGSSQPAGLMGFHNDSCHFPLVRLSVTPGR